MRTTTWIKGIAAITITLGLAGASPCFAIDTPDTGYQITSTDKVIDVFSVCKKVRSSSLTLFAPTKTAGEWNPFLTWSANNTDKVTLSACGAAPTCSDGIQNQGETGVDCGGPCSACGPPGPTCGDNVQNQGETGVDCGGPCAACLYCGDKICNNGETCGSCPGDCPGECTPGNWQYADTGCRGPGTNCYLNGRICLSNCQWGDWGGCGNYEGGCCHNDQYPCAYGDPCWCHYP